MRKLNIIDDKKSVIIEVEVNVMLCQFTVKNFKSIRDEVTFDMQAAAISEHEDRIIKDKDGESYLPVSAVYGPNGGGKSNVLEALHSLVLKVLRPLYATSDNEEAAIKMKKLEIEPFVFAKDTVNKPTEFELFFRTDLSEYRYELTIRKDVVEYERLDRVKLETGRRSALFERDENETVLKGAFAKLKISDELSDTLPLLSYIGITYRKNEVVKDVLDWFDKKVDFLNYGNPIQEMRMVTAKSEEVKRLMLQMIQEMDLDIIDFRIEEKENHRIEVFTKHVVDEYEAELNLLEESSGTRKLFGLLPLVAKSLLEGTTLVIDELDAKIHPVLLKYIIMMFNNMEVNKKRAQLIFTSHDLSTMNSEVFRRDEIWFVAKGNRQNSKLYSLVEFKNEKGESVRKDAKFDKQYLEGKYGADPYLRKIIDWGQVNG
jgi:AAA15 family ATPase/GTPase